MGVRDVRPRHAHHVGLAAGDDFLGDGGIADRPRTEDREPCHRLDRRREADQVGGREVHGRDMFGQAHQVRVRPGAHVDEVELPRRLEAPHDRPRLVEPEPSGDQLVGGQPDPHGRAEADGAAHGAHDLQAESHPPGEFAPVVVGPPVGERRQELGDQVAVGALELDAVHPAVVHPAGRCRECLDQLGDLPGRQLVRHRLAKAPIHERRGRHEGPHVRHPAHAPHVGQHDKDVPAVGVHRVGDRPPGVHDARIVGIHNPAHPRARRMDARRARDHEPGAAGGPLGVVVDGPRIGQAVGVGVVRRVRGDQDTVRKREPSDPDRAQKVIEHPHA